MVGQKQLHVCCVTWWTFHRHVRLTDPCWVHTLMSELCFRYSDVMKQEVLKQATLQVVQSMTGALAAAARQAGLAEGPQQQPTGRLVLPTLTILLEWWSVNPSFSM